MARTVQLARMMASPMGCRSMSLLSSHVGMASISPRIFSNFASNMKPNTKSSMKPNSLLCCLGSSCHGYSTTTKHAFHGHASATTMDKIILNDLRFYGKHGCHDAEVELGQQFVVSVELHVPSKTLLEPCMSDDVKHTISYDQVFYDVKDIVEGPHRRLIETVAQDIASTVLEKYAMCKSVVVKVMKPNAPVAGIHGGLGVEIIRSRA